MKGQEKGSMAKLSKGLEWLIEQEVIHKPKLRQEASEKSDSIDEGTPHQITVADRKVVVLYKRSYRGGGSLPLGQGNEKSK